MKIKRLFGLHHPLIGAPAGYCRAGDRASKNGFQLVQAAADFIDQLLFLPYAAPLLPAMVIPGVKANFMSLRHVADNLSVSRANTAARPGGTRQQNIPAIQRCRARAKHLPQELRFYQAPQMTPHVIRPDAEEKTGLDTVLFQHRHQPGNAFARTAKSIHINAQTYFFHDGFSSVSSTVRRKKSSVSSTVCCISTVGCQSRQRFALRMLGLRCSTS